MDKGGNKSTSIAAASSQPPLSADVWHNPTGRGGILRKRTPRADSHTGPSKKSKADFVETASAAVAEANNQLQDQNVDHPAKDMDEQHVDQHGNHKPFLDILGDGFGGSAGANATLER